MLKHIIKSHNDKYFLPNRTLYLDVVQADCNLDSSVVWDTTLQNVVRLKVPGPNKCGFPSQSSQTVLPKEMANSELCSQTKKCP